MCRCEKFLQVQFILVIILNLVLCDFKLLLLHTNDMHSRFEETNAHSGQCLKGKCYGGFARLKTAVDKMRTEARDRGMSSIFLNAGDTYQGSIYYTMFKWKVVSELLNMMNLDVMSLGNHEFDGGPEGLSPFIANSSVPIVCSNIDHSARPEFQNLTQLVPSKVLDVDGVKVGVIGYLTPETKFISLLGDDIKLKDEITEIKKEVERLKREGVEILIALGHSGFSTDKLIAEHVPDLDVVVGGHTNTFLFTGHDPDIEKSEGSYPTVVTQPSGRKVLVVQAYAFTKYLGRLELTFDDEGEVIHSTGNPILLDDSFRKDGAVERAVLKYGNELKHLTGRKIGFSKAYLDGNQNCRLGECNIGNLVTDALVDDNAKDFYGSGWTDAPVAMVQGGGLRSSIDTKETGGVIAYSDLLEVLPFQNSVERLTLTGSVLMRVLEHSVSRYSKEERVGGFMQYSGIQVEYDLSKPPQKRVVSALVRCGDCKVPNYLPLDVNKVYSVLTSTFLAEGGDGYSMFEYAKERKTLSFSDVDAVENYLKRVSPVYPEVSGRIRFVDHKQISRSSASSSYSTNYLLLLAVFIVTCLPKA
ncbi:snake venom 5'-nucleotidase-like [Homalodisca vitripennis]|uniref:snake venom 5'-nucleotidase-like n=1 Tax=Homalodisca vitripennis TaxID=197043 RepID=UPI001EEB19FE|nr:snake venom 5'-nucleotidase-like [Homalodisca vitripennis]XP_046664547.1 snake venom 5'-nucleotidase-like [Homalodisca vitripennis]